MRQVCFEKGRLDSLVLWADKRLEQIRSHDGGQVFNMKMAPTSKSTVFPGRERLRSASSAHERPLSAFLAHKG